MQPTTAWLLCVVHSTDTPTCRLLLSWSLMHTGNSSVQQQSSTGRRQEMPGVKWHLSGGPRMHGGHARAALMCLHASRLILQGTGHCTPASVADVQSRGLTGTKLPPLLSAQTADESLHHVERRVVRRVPSAAAPLPSPRAAASARLSCCHIPMLAAASPGSLAAAGKRARHMILDLQPICNQSTINIRQVRGPASFMPESTEWVHTFSWHGSMINGKGSKTGTPSDLPRRHRFTLHLMAY